MLSLSKRSALFVSFLMLGAACTAEQPSTSSSQALEEPATRAKGTIYVTTQDTGYNIARLYTFEPSTQTFTLVGALDCLGVGESLLEIAINSQGEMYGIFQEGWAWNPTSPRWAGLTIDPKTAKCTKLGTAVHDEDRASTTLAFVPKGTLDPNDDTLVRVGEGYDTVDPVSGAPTSVSTLSDRLAADETDVVYANGSLWGVGWDPYTSFSDFHLFEVNPTTGALIGTKSTVAFNTDQTRVAGLAAQDGVIYAFGFDDASGEPAALQIDPATGAGTPLTNLKGIVRMTTPNQEQIYAAASAP